MIKSSVPESVNVAHWSTAFFPETTYCRVYPKILWFYDWSLALEDFWHIFPKSLRNNINLVLTVLSVSDNWNSSHDVSSQYLAARCPYTTCNCTLSKHWLFGNAAAPCIILRDKVPDTAVCCWPMILSLRLYFYTPPQFVGIHLHSDIFVWNVFSYTL